MTRGLNKVLLIGRLGHDPELRYTPSGKPVTTFSISTNRSWNTSDGDKHTETEWFNIVAWGSLAEICKQFLTKQRLVYIEGRLQTRHWEDNDGKKRTSIEIVANEMIMLDEKKDGNNELVEEEEITQDEYLF